MPLDISPYRDAPLEDWPDITRDLVRRHPLTPRIVDFCLKSWYSILHGRINTYLNLRICDMNISPQATGALLHDIIPEYISRNTPGFRKGIGKEKDIVCEFDEFYSMELKTSSQKAIFGNRSYALSKSGKSKSGYYLAINFEKINANDPKILLIRMGWLDDFDWMAQRSETGQQAALTKTAKAYKLIPLYDGQSGQRFEI